MSSDVGVERICSILNMERSCYLINSFFFWIVDQSYSALHLKCHSSNEVCKFADIICTWQHLFLYPIPFRPRFHLRYVHFNTRMWSRTIEMLMKIGANGVKQLFIFFLKFFVLGIVQTPQTIRKSREFVIFCQKLWEKLVKNILKLLNNFVISCRNFKLFAFLSSWAFYLV